jgi:UDP-N-acetylglucosamine acyltransferase
MAPWPRKPSFWLRSWTGGAEAPVATQIHPTAVVEPGAQLGSGVEVGAYCYVGAGVRLGERTRLIAHATVLGPTELGAGNVVYPYATLGADPQDRSYKQEPTRLLVGDDCVFREQVTVHRGTLKGGGVTSIGSRCLLMVGAHVAHDCVVEDDVVLTNLSTLGGHVRVGFGAVSGGQVAVAPYVRLGELCFIAGGARVERDVPPYMIAQGDRARVRALNQVGLERKAVPLQSRAALERAFRLIFGGKLPRAQGVEAVRREMCGDAYVDRLLAFLEASTQR